MRKVNIEELKTLYCQGLNDSQISKILKVNNVTIKNNRESLNLPSNFKYKKKINKEEFLHFYNLRYKDTKIAEILNISKSAVQNFRKSLNLPHNDKIYETTTLNFEEEQVLIGGLLGDSYLRNPYKSANGGFTHCLKQKEYCFWKKQKLNRFTSELKETYQIDKRTGKKHDKVICRILSNPVFNPYYSLFYINNTKVINKELLYRLEGLGLAVWFMDDGCKHKNTYSLATNCFSLEELQLIQKFFMDKFNIECSIHGNAIIYIKQKSASIFKLLIAPYIVDCMRYKL